MEEEEGREGAVTAPREAEGSIEWIGHLSGTLDPPSLFLFLVLHRGFKITGLPFVLGGRGGKVEEG